MATSHTLEDVLAGRWLTPATGTAPTIPIDSLVLERSLDGAEADLLAPLDLGRRLAIVCDPNTYTALGQRVERALTGRWHVDLVLLDDPHADQATVETLRHRTAEADALVAVGSGTINDLCKYATLRDGRPFVVFATAASMNGYTSTTAAITDGRGVKRSLPAHAPRGLFMDLEVMAAAPSFLTRSGLGDCLCRSTAQVDWLMSHLLRDTHYDDSPFVLQAADEAVLLERADRLETGDLEAVDALVRVLTLCGLGVLYTGTSHHGSMSEHLISHFIDMFAGDAHPGTLHGHQVGVAAVSMARLQRRILMRATPPEVAPTAIDAEALTQRYGAEISASCLEQWRSKALDAEGAQEVNRRLRADWDALRERLLAHSLPGERLEATLRSCGAPVRGTELGLEPDFYERAIRHAREIRDRWSILDLAGDAGELDAFAMEER
ncbi:sn-glycerol-1-phosphate dehydrogenase [Rhodovibrio salinarum]|uniref:3-dehydroquinate synthase n=1 Tax=Rhodovibrio salinarum TaxID=1087 RepID=A0A934QH40_9PROT|nr:sn-glycerol-1-phosphate dehydrogenase [Rhodovibrio salinarum]MBK1696405.1 3-dehydroquinate synthase [Rhodovibrio salinarum]